MYSPKPLDTSDVVLDKTLLELTEKIAENVHNVWARGRIESGWTYGQVRNDELKQTPCLVPYDALTEEEKEYDRQTAMETIKFIVKSGYTIQKG